MSKVQWERMFPDELEAAIHACPVVYLPYGLCEPHGLHNAVGLDALKAHGICCRAAKKHGGIVAPPDYWHVHEIGAYASWADLTVGEVRPWLSALPPWMHFKNVCYHVRGSDALAFHAALLVTGHYGPNWEDLKALLEILQPHFAMRMYGLPDFEANKPGFDNDEKSGGDHAGKVETSLLWSLEPDCVDVSRLPDPDDANLPFAMAASAHQSDRQTGERMVDDEVKWLGRKAQELLQDYQKHKPDVRKPVSFDQVEHIWENEVRPRLGEFKSMQYLDREPPAPSSRWQLNYRIPDHS
mgnify:CR=1 FL=1